MPTTEPEPIVAPVDRAAAALKRFQAPDGELASIVSNQRDMRGVRSPDTNFFTTPQVIWSLSFVDGDLADDVKKSAGRFVIEGQEDGAWRFFTRKIVRNIDPDADCTGCAAAALLEIDPAFRTSSAGTRARDLLLAHRDDEGRFLTWFRTEGPNDVDAVANANVLWFLGDADGTEGAAVWLNRMMKAGPEPAQFPYYETPLALFHAASRAYFAGAHALSDGMGWLVEGVEAHRKPDGTYGNALETAFAVLSLINAGLMPATQSVQALMDMQLDDGCWPDCAAWNGPEWPAPRSIWWGGPTWTTALAMEALARAQL